MRAGEQFLVIVRTGAAAHRIGALNPARAAVCRAPYPSFTAVQLNRRVHHIGILRRDSQADLAEVALGQALLEPGPAAAAVGGLVQGGLRSAAHIARYRAVMLPGGRVQHVGITRIDNHIGHAGPLAAAQGFLPGVAAVGGFVQAALAAFAPQRAVHRRPHRVRVLRVHDDRGDVLGVLQPLVGPGVAAVLGKIDAVAKAHVAAADVFARADPDPIRLRGIDGDVADRVRHLLVEQRSPGDARVFCFPDPARTHGHVPDAVVSRVPVDIGDTPGHKRRSDRAPGQAAVGVGSFFVCRVQKKRRSGQRQGQHDAQE